MAEIDVLMLRNDPSIDAETPWAMEAGILFGREAVKRGVIVLNDPDSLGRAINKLYFQSFPVEARAETLITKHDSDIKAFAKAHQGNIILKPLQGSGGSGVFKLDAKSKSNLNQIIEAIGRDGYIIAQAYVPAAKKGDIRFFLMNGHPLQVGGKYAALRRVASPDDIRSNIHAGGKAEAVEIGETELRVAEMIRPKLVADGMFLVGIDIVGDKILEVNVFSPGNLNSCSRLAGVDFSIPVSKRSSGKWRSPINMCTASTTATWRCSDRILARCRAFTGMEWRRGWDSNPRYRCRHAAFRVRCFRPLSHLSAEDQDDAGRRAAGSVAGGPLAAHLSRCKGFNRLPACQASTTLESCPSCPYPRRSRPPAMELARWSAIACSISAA